MGDPEGGLIGFILICIIVFTVMFFKAVREWGRPERERKAAEGKEAKEQETQIDAEIPANGGLLANAKISADALKKLHSSED